MRRLALIASLLTLCGTAAAAGGSATNTELVWKGSGRTCIDGKCTASGRVLVSSDKRACVKGRQVHFFAVYANGEKRKFDSDRATEDGLAGGYGAVKQGLKKVASVAPTTQAKGVTCRGAKFTFVFP